MARELSMQQTKTMDNTHSSRNTKQRGDGEKRKRRKAAKICKYMVDDDEEDFFRAAWLLLFLIG